MGVSRVALCFKLKEVTVSFKSNWLPRAPPGPRLPGCQELYSELVELRVWGLHSKSDSVPVQPLQPNRG